MTVDHDKSGGGRLDDTAVVVLGGAGVLGSAAARACARAGARVAVGYRSSATKAAAVVTDIVAPLNKVTPLNDSPAVLTM